MSITDLKESCREASERITYMEELLGEGLMQPFNNNNSASRKIMHSVHRMHVYPLFRPEVALVSCGYEKQYGINSSSVLVADGDYRLLCKIPKYTYPKVSNDHYYAIMLNTKTNVLKVHERIGYKYRTESYGYMYNNDLMDSLQVGDIVNEGTILRKSGAFDEYDNRADGLNLLSAYFANNETTEDGIVASDVAADALASPLIKIITPLINDNDIMLNLYGDNNNYKVLPDIGEEVKNGILCAVRQEKKQESLFSQSYDRLNELMIPDETFLANGVVIDIEVCCNNPIALAESPYNVQLKKYYDDSMNTNRTIVNMVEQFVNTYHCTLDYDLEKLCYVAKALINGGQYIRDRVYSGTMLKITVVERNPLKVGDKVSDRYGGKGVISKIIPEEQMPMLDNGERVQIINNYAGCVNRENPGQLFEIEINHISSRIVEFMTSGMLDIDECLDMYKRFIKILSPSQYEFICKYIDNLTEEDATIFLQSIINDQGIMVSIDPISSNMGIDVLDKLYKEFSFAVPNTIMVPIIGSDGKTRMVKGRRTIIAGRKYIYRLKQYAEEKFSATSLSAININGENARNRASKDYKSLYIKTPTRWGEMETGDLGHAGFDAVLVNFMINSASVIGRRRVKELITGDPFDPNIQLDEYSTNTNAEKVNTLLKAMGYRLVFIKKPKNRIQAMRFVPMKRPKMIEALTFKKDLPEDYASRLIDASRDPETGFIKALKINALTILDDPYMEKKKKEDENNE